MSWLYSQALVEAYLGVHYWGGAPSAPSSKMHMPLRSWLRGKMTGAFTLSRYGTMYEPLTDDLGEAWLTSYLAGFPVRTYRSPERNKGLQGKGQDSGGTSLASFAKWCPLTFSWKTVQRSLFEDSTLYSGTWPRSGMMRRGVCSGRTMLERRTSENASGLSVSYPTPCALDKGGGRFNRSLSAGAAVRPTLGAMARHNLWPTPTRQDASNNAGPSQMRRNSLPLNAAIGGPLNPDWVEWLMGWPIGWTALEPLGTGKFQAWRRSHGANYIED